MFVEGGDEKITAQWIKQNAPRAIQGLGMLPLIPLPNTDRDCGEWFLGIDRKHEHTTVLLYCGRPGPSSSYRRIATIDTRRELVKLYDHLAGVGKWHQNQRKEANNV